MFLVVLIQRTAPQRAALGGLKVLVQPDHSGRRRPANVLRVRVGRHQLGCSDRKR